KGKYDYLDGIMIAQSCLHIRQSYTSWIKHIPTDFHYYLPMPNNVQSPHAVTYLTGELKVFKSAIEKWIGKEISDEDIHSGIKLMNENRSLMHKLYEYKKKENPPISGEETMEVAISQQLVDKKEHIQALTQLLEKLKTGASEKNTGTRLMLMGSENDDIPFVQMVESVDGTIVIEDHCIGTRYFWNNVEEVNGDPISALAKRYVERPACPSKDWMDRSRVDHLINLAKDYDVKGAIVIQQKFCDPHELDIPSITKELNNAGIKTLFLEFDVTVPIGQFKIRVEAFLEMLQEEDLFA
ncbi:MAG: benzoyl-CoA reductase, partial [Ignavibacteriaceae bacterium]|nr:benzoyl-CoA reductase [Ignavibacteriaceae bacterium]